MCGDSITPQPEVKRKRFAAITFKRALSDIDNSHALLRLMQN